MKSLGSIGSFLWALLLVLLAFVCTGNSFEQELWFYDAQGIAKAFFRVAMSDTSAYGLIFPKVTKACARGLWDLFSDVNFQTHYNEKGSYTSSDFICTDFTTAASVKSLRHIGANDTDTDSLSLYEGANLTGKEVFVTERAVTGIKNQIRYVAITGTANWMLFEGQDLNGKSACYKLLSGYNVYWNSMLDLNLRTIGSVFKGCNLQEIQNYKTLHKSSFVNSN